MSMLSSVLISIAIIDGLVTIGLLLMWLKGMLAIVVHNFVIQMPTLIVVLILIDLIIVVLAMVASRQSVSSNGFTMTNVF
jgi:apolipoprotein N-acyltransferase